VHPTESENLSLKEKMNLPEEEYLDFLHINQSLLLYAGKQKGVLDKKLTLTAFREEMDAKLIMECAEAFYENLNILNNFIKDNPAKLNAAQLAVADGFRHFEKGTFFVYKYLSKYTVFIKDDLVYGVYALSDPFEAFFGNHLPTYVETVLLPYKDKIVYHGLFMGGRMRFGSGYKRSLNEVYKKAKAKYGIITQLPFSGDSLYAKQSPSDQLKFFMKTKGSREEFENDIDNLITQYPNLLPLYHQEWGRVHSSFYKKKFKNLGLNKAYYALLQGQIIGSSLKQKDLSTLINQLVPSSKRDWVYTFRM